MQIDWNSVRANCVASFDFILAFEADCRTASRNELHILEDCVNDLDAVFETVNNPDYLEGLIVRMTDAPLVSILSSFLDGFAGDSAELYSLQDWPQVRFVIRLLRDSWTRDLNIKGFWNED